MTARTVVVTGGAGALGRAIATGFSQDGWRVIVMDVAADRLAETAAAVSGRAIQCDVMNRDEVERAFTDAGRTGPIDCLVNAAGLTRTGRSEHLSADDWATVIGVNLTGTFHACQAAHPVLREGAASIVNISSISATRVLPGRAAYTSSKAGINALTASLAVEWASAGIRVNAVAPAWIDNAFLHELAARGVLDPLELVQRIPLGRLCTDADVVGAVQFFANPQVSGFITGQVLHVDGGYVPSG